MTFEETIQKNYDSLPIDIKWWAKFAFHYTDIKNALSILKMGTLYSRSTAQKEHLMRNDNASLQVIDMTSSNVLSYVRFYFRPLTPTQYYNEGFKPVDLRYDRDPNANVPVPIFFAFNLNKLLDDPNVKFSAFSQAGYGAPIVSGVDEFAKLPFEKIYGDGPTDNENRKYRHAELLYPSSYSIMDSLEAILCRNEFEQSMLLTLLRKENESLFYKFKPFIKICKDKMFQKNGFFLQDINLNQDKISFSFSDTSQKRYSTPRLMSRNEVDELKPIKVVFSFEWRNSRNILQQASAQLEFDYLNSGGVVFTIPHIEKSTVLAVTVTCANDLIGYKEFMLSNII